MTFINLTFLPEALIPDALTLDTLCLGGLWSKSAYRREIDSPNSDLIAITCAASLPSSAPQSLDPGLTKLHGDADTEQISTQASTQASTPDVSLSSSPAIAMGCLWAIVDEAHITLLAVHPDMQRRGLGTLLLWALLYRAHQRGMKRATLEVRVSNKGAIALYERFGFKTAGTRKKYYSDTGEDALVLWLSGLQHPSFPAILDRWRKEIDGVLSCHGWNLKEDIEPDSLKF